MKRLAIYFGSAVVGLLAVVFVSAAILGTSERPAPPITAGVTQLSLAAPHRDVPLPVTLWYPTPSRNEPTLLGQNALFYGAYAQIDAVPAPSALPVVLLSHGSGGNAVRLGWLATDLANKGFIVAAVDHPGTRSRDSDPFQTIKIWERPDDLSLVLDMLDQTPPVGLEVDMGRVGIIGFSLGGQTALAMSGVQYEKDAFIRYCAANAGQHDCGWMQAAGVDFAQIDQTRYEADHSDPRIGATVAVDPAGGRAVAESSTLTTKSLVINLGAAGSIPEAMRADDLAAAWGTEYMTVPDSWHFSFLADCSQLGRIMMWVAGEDAICSDVNGRDRRSVHRELNAAIGDFFTGAIGAP